MIFEEDFILNENRYRDELFQWVMSLRSLLIEEDLSNREKDISTLQLEINQLATQLKNSPTMKDETLYKKAMEVYRKLRVLQATPVPIGQHSLPPLPYSYDALEPYISKRIMKLHHDKHHQSYVDGLNKAEVELKKARESGDYSLIKHWERELSFHGAGHYLHTIFWHVMSPKGGGNPKDALRTAIETSFGDINKMKKQFSEAANAVEGSGWAILGWSPRTHRLEILQAEKHQNLSQWDFIPLLVLDVWEHAYYLQYENNRREYINNWWNVVNWPEVEKRFTEAKKVKWSPY